jgi:hypothetical protein
MLAPGERIETAILFLTHVVSDEVVKSFLRIQSEVSENAHAYFVLHTGGREANGTVPPGVSVDRFIELSDAELLALPYPRKCDPKGWSGKGWHIIDNVDTLPLAFFRRYPDYSYYWGIEYDVFFTGEWGEFVDHFERSDADLIGTVMEPRSTAPEIDLAPPLRNAAGKAFADDEVIRGFFPLFRVSRCFLMKMDSCYCDGWNGHYEFSWGTCARAFKMKLETFGGTGPYVHPTNRDRFYFNRPSRWDIAPGIFIYSPTLPFVLPIPDTLWHPVKPRGDYYRHSARPFDRNWMIRAKRLLKLTLIYGMAIAWFFRARRHSEP